MVKVYPPHQDKGERIHSRLIPESDLSAWLGRGWTLDYLVSIGERCVVCDDATPPPALEIIEGSAYSLQEQEDEVKQEEVSEPKRRGRPRKGI
jgi:hypothetical protein